MECVVRPITAVDARGWKENNGSNGRVKDFVRQYGKMEGTGIAGQQQNNGFGVVKREPGCDGKREGEV